MRRCVWGGACAWEPAKQSHLLCACVRAKPYVSQTPAAVREPYSLFLSDAASSLPLSFPSALFSAIPFFCVCFTSSLRGCKTRCPPPEKTSLVWVEAWALGPLKAPQPIPTRGKVGDHCALSKTQPSVVLNTPQVTAVCSPDWDQSRPPSQQRAGRGGSSLRSPACSSLDWEALSLGPVDNPQEEAVQRH